MTFPRISSEESEFEHCNKIHRKNVSHYLTDSEFRELNNPQYWGIYCPQHYGSWDCDPTGRIYAYPTKEIANAHIEYMKANRLHVDNHLWESVEFGKQKYFDPHKAEAGTEICPVRNPAHFTEAYGQ